MMAGKRLKKSATQSISDRWSDASALTKILVITTVIGGVTGSIVGIAAAIPVIEPYWYVAQHELRKVTDRQAVATDRQTLFQLQEYLDRAKKDPAAARSPIVQQRINDLSQQIKDTEDRLKKSDGRK